MIRFAAVGFTHNHIFNMVRALLDAGAELVSFYDETPSRIAEFITRFPHGKQVQTLSEILEDETIELVVSASIPNERAPLGIKVMQADKDYLCAKPGITDLNQLAQVRQVQTETKRKYLIYFGERLDSRSTLHAIKLVQEGTIGQVVQTVGFGPHRLLGRVERPEWSFDNQYFGGIINDLASHQIDQFLLFTNSTQAEVLTAHVGNFKHKQFTKMHDFGDLIVRSPSATGYIRVDWLTPKGLNTWGDVRLFVLGTDGYLELRKNTDLAGRSGDNHLFLVDNHGTHYMDCSHIRPQFATHLIQDIQQRTETAMSQSHCFLTSELALQAEQLAFELA